MGQVSQKKKFRIYRLVNPTLPEDHPDRVRYVGETTRALEDRFADHWGERSETGTAKQAWLAELERAGIQPRIELLEIVFGTKEDAFRRESYWKKMHCELGYRLTNRIANPESFPQFLSDAELEERKRYLEMTLEPMLARCNETGIKRLIKEREILIDLYKVENKIIAGLLKEKLRTNEAAIRQALSEGVNDPGLAAIAAKAIDKPLPKRRMGPTLGELKSELRQRMGLPEDATLQDCIDAILHPSPKITPAVTDKQSDEVTYFEQHRAREDERLLKLESDILAKIESGEYMGEVAEILREAIGAGGLSAMRVPKSESIAISGEPHSSRISQLPAVRRYLEIVKEKVSE